ncbi:MAG: hypothetical protein ABS938_17550 [Psychrobacillus psychrodurans]
MKKYILGSLYIMVMVIFIYNLGIGFDQTNSMFSFLVTICIVSIISLILLIKGIAVEYRKFILFATAVSITIATTLILANTVGFIS